MSRHKKQHYVPACYLRAWCDESAPKNQTPYVWVFDKDGSNPRRKAPENIFHETDMYTIQVKGGDRILRLEHGLRQLETEFTRIRNKKLKYGRPLDKKEHVLLCAFIAAAQFRTPASREHHREQWERPLRMIEELMEWSKTATLEQKRRAATMSPTSSKSKSSLTYEEVKELYENPIQKMMEPVILTLTPSLTRLDMAVFEAQGESIGFITSDHPCAWFDSDAYRRPPLYSAPALIYKTIEITLPISPRQCVCLNRMGTRGYLPATEMIVDEFNRRTRFQADKYFVVNRNEFKAIWFDAGVEPEDSWERLHGGKNEE